MYTLTFTIEGPSEQGGNVRLDDFERQLKGYRLSLAHTDRLLSGGSTMYMRVVGLSHSSPATVTIELVKKKKQEDFRPQIIKGFSQSLVAVQEKRPLPPWADAKLLEHLLSIAEPIGTKIKRGTVKSDGAEISIDQHFKSRLKLLLAPRETCYGSVEGKLLAADLHTDKNLFYIYPRVGPSRVRCIVPESKKEAAKRSLERRVEVRGVLSFSRATGFPTSVEVEEIEELGDNEVSIFDIRGIAPDCTGDMSSEDFVRTLRSEWA